MADEDTKLHAVAVSHVAPGPRFLYAGGTKVVVKPGEVLDLQMTAAEIKAASLHKLDPDGEIDTFTLDRDGDDLDAPLPGLTISELRKVAAEEQIDLGNLKKRDEIANAIIAARAAKANAAQL